MYYENVQEICTSKVNFYFLDSIVNENIRDSEINNIYICMYVRTYLKVHLSGKINCFARVLKYKFI